jgi:hypothetical protein
VSGPASPREMGETMRDSAAYCYACRIVIRRDAWRHGWYDVLRGLTFFALPPREHDFDAMWAEHQRILLEDEPS